MKARVLRTIVDSTGVITCAVSASTTLENN